MSDVADRLRRVRYELDAMRLYRLKLPDTIRQRIADALAEFPDLDAVKDWERTIVVQTLADGPLADRIEKAVAVKAHKHTLVEQQRDELAAALGGIRDMRVKCEHTAKAVEIATAALAKLEEQP